MATHTLSWADRARTNQALAGQKVGQPSNQTSTALSMKGAQRPPSAPSSESSHYNPSSIEHENDEETPASSLAPSAASVDEMHDPKATLKPAPAPPVNVWSVRKQTVQLSASPKVMAPSAPSQSQTAGPSENSAPALSASDTSSSAKDNPSLSASATSPADGKDVTYSLPQTTETHGPAVAGLSGTLAPKPFSDAWKPVQKATVLPLSQNSEADDANDWPSPDAASLAALEKRKAASQQAQKVAEASEAPKTEKKKAKWIPIQADITVKSSNVPKPGHIDAVQRRQERNRDQNLHRQGRALNSSTSNGGSGAEPRRKRESTAPSMNASRPASQASNRTADHRSGSVASSRRPSLGLASAPRFEMTQEQQQQQRNASSATPSTSRNSQRVSPVSAAFVYEPSSAVQAGEVSGVSEPYDVSPQNTVEGTYQPESMHGPLLPGSFRRGGRPGYTHNNGGGGSSSSSKGSRSHAASRNTHTNGRHHYYNDQSRQRPDSSTNRSSGSRYHHSMHTETYPSYPQDYYYNQGQTWFPAMNGYYPSIPAAAQYMPLQPVIAPYVDGGTGLLFERPHPNNLNLLMEPPLEPTAYWVLGQIEFYLSEDNLARDTFLREQMDNEGWVDIGMLASFKRIQSLTADLDLIAEALARSSVLETRSGQVRRRTDWFKWVMPNAKPSSTSPGLEQAVEASLTQRRESVPQISDKMFKKEEIQVEAHPFPQGLSPHSQHPLIIGGTDAPPKRWRSPASRRAEVPEAETAQA